MTKHTTFNDLDVGQEFKTNPYEHFWSTKVDATTARADMRPTDLKTFPIRPDAEILPRHPRR